MEQKREYIFRYQEREGIRLDISHNTRNPGSKATAKLMLNRHLFQFFSFSSHPVSWFLFCSFWGKFGEQIKSPLLSRSKIPPICSVYYPMPPSTSALSNCAPTDILEAFYTIVHNNAVKGSKTNIFVARWCAHYDR